MVIQEMEKHAENSGAAVVRLPTSLPELPRFEPFDAGTTPDSISKQLDAADRGLKRFRALVERLVSASAAAGGPGESATLAWVDRNLQPLIEAGWDDASTWYQQLYGLTAAVKDIAEHLPEWRRAAEQVQQLVRQHTSIGMLLIECAARLRTPATALPGDPSNEGRA